METTDICPACGMANPIYLLRCRQCGQLLSPAAPSYNGPEPQPLPTRDQFQHLQHTQQRFLERPQVKPVRSSTRRKFLAGVLGSAAILGLGSPLLAKFLQNIQVSFSTKNFPYDNYNDLLSMSFSPDLNIMAMFKYDGPNSGDDLIYLWDYQRQHMTTIPANPSGNVTAWSPDGKYLLCPTTNANNSNSLDIWDVQARTKIRSSVNRGYDLNMNDGSDTSGPIHWSPDGSQIALMLKDSFVILDSARLAPLSTFSVSPNEEAFVWSPDSRKLALLVGKYQVSSGSVQIWDVQTRKMEAEVFFQGGEDEYIPTMVWSPDGAHIAVLSHGQLRIIRVASTFNSYTLDVPNNFGRLSWSPDGKYLAVAVERGSVKTSFSNRFEIWDVVAKNRVRVLDDGSIFSETPKVIAWSKDGSHITTIAQIYQQENWYWL